jgi:adenine-specific DNA-methyltransferase
LLETIAKYDNPPIKGVTGMREYEDKKSTFCNAKTALRDLELVAKTAKYNFLVMSYNSEGIMSQEDIINMMSKYGSVKLEQFQYARFKSNNNGLAKTKKHIYEQLYILTK